MFVSAISPTRSLLATHAPSETSVTSALGQSRLVVKCYDSKVSISTLKFSLIANNPSTSFNSEDVDEEGSGSVGSIRQLQFCGNQDEFLVAALPPSHILVWDIRRGVISQTVEIPKSFELCALAVNHNQSDQLKSQSGTSSEESYLCYALVKNIESSKMLVLVYDIATGKQVRKVKVGTSSPQDVMGIAINTHRNVAAVRNGKRLKIVNMESGSTVSKMKLKDEANGQHHYENSSTSSMISPVSFSDDGTVISTTISNGACFFSLEGVYEKTGDDKDNPGKPIGKLHTSKAEDRVSTLELDSISQTECIVAATEEKSGIVSLYKLNPNGVKSKKALSSFAKVDCSIVTNDVSSKGKGSRLGRGAYFPIGSSTSKKDVIFVESGMKSVGSVEESVFISEVTYRKLQSNSMDDEESTLMSGNLYPRDNDDQEPESAGRMKKRKATEISDKVLGPGEIGNESMVGVTDSVAQSAKRTKQSDDDAGAYEFKEEDEGNENGKTIAERLAFLSSELDRETDDDDLMDQASSTDVVQVNPSETDTSTIFNVKRATSDSLAFLLRQALVSNDDTQLETAFKVSDRTMIEKSIAIIAAESEEEADQDILLILLSKLATRLARKPGRSENLLIWIQTIIVNLMSSRLSSYSSGPMSKSKMQIALKLGPLRNLLKERVENLPKLLMLEGRLKLLEQKL